MTNTTEPFKWRQPGSVFKPFVYTTALDNGYPVTEQLLNQPVVLNIQKYGWNMGFGRYKIHDGSTGGLTTFREGLKKIIKFNFCSNGSTRYRSR